MEVHHEVYQEDPDWVELLVDEEHKKQLKVVSISYTYYRKTIPYF